MKTSYLLMTLAGAAALSVGCGGSSADTPVNASSTTSTTPTATPAPTLTPASSTPTSGAITDANTCALPSYLSALMNAVNTARAAARSCGSQNFAATTPLTWNDKLFAASAAHSLDMAQNNYFNHNSQDGTTFDKRINATGYNWSAAGENIAAGQIGVNDVMQSWLQSPGHCANIMNPNFKDIGVGCAKGTTNSSYSSYWTMDLAAPL